MDQDDENDPSWFKEHQSGFPCYKLAEAGLFNFEALRNPDGDWEVSDSRGRQISFNLCHYAAREESCPSLKDDTFAFMKSGGHCFALTSNEPKAEISEAVE